MKRILSVLLTVLTLCLTGCAGTSTDSVPETTQTASEITTSDAADASPLTVTFMKVGKADGIILQTAEHTAVIDCGEKTDGKKMVARLQEYGVETVDYMILTHYDQDHIGGAPKVIENFEIGHVIAPLQKEDSKQYQKLTEALDAKGLSLELPTTPMTFTLDDVEFTVYPHRADDYKEGYDNNCSHVIRVTHHQETLLFTGDAMEERLAEIMDIGDCDLLKVPYHGREIANLPTFLEKVKPEYAVITTDAENISETTVSALQEIGAETYITYLDGNIIAVSDGTSISITNEGLPEVETT